jgi:fatty acid desaturase
MTTEEKTLLAVLTIAAVLVPVALGAALGWPAWSRLLLAVPLLGALGLVARNIQRRVRYELSLSP